MRISDWSSDVCSSDLGMVLSEDQWKAHEHEWLATPEDRAFVASLMGRVVEPGKFANWIAPPVIGVNRQPINFEYVRRSEERRVGKEGVSTVRFRWSPYH